MKKTVLILIVLMLTGSGIWFWTHREKAEAAAEAQKFVPAQVELKTLRRTVESTGEVRPENRLSVKSPVSGRIEELLVREGDSVEKSDVIAWVSSTERATLLDAARAKGADELAYWESVYKAAPLIAPMAGTVIDRSFEPGQTINASDAVVVIADRLILVGQVDETDIGAIFTDQAVDIQLDAYPDARFSGTVKAIAYDSKIVSNVTMYEVDVTAENLPEFARSGMTATLTFVVEEHKKVPAVPTSALEYRNGTAFVRPPATSGKDPLPVQTGLSGNGFTEIVGGLQAGDSILIPQIVRKVSNGTNPFLPGRAGTKSKSSSSNTSSRNAPPPPH